VYHLPEDRFEEVATHDMFAITNGWPALLHYNGGGQAKLDNRRAAYAAYTGRQPTATENKDEYPYAATQEGGASASVWPLDAKQNQAQGNDWNGFRFRNRLTIGGAFVVEIVPSRPFEYW
jgi:hypothetical protein